MHFDFQSNVPAPIDQVCHVVHAVDEYPAWNSRVRQAEDGLRWALPLVNGGEVDLRASVSVATNAAVISLRRRRLLGIEHRVELEATGPAHTDVRVATTTNGPLGLFADRFALFNSVRGLCLDLASRSRWLPQAPDTAYLPQPSGFFPHDGGRTASLEQLRTISRELEGGILAIDAGASCLLLDLERRRFLRAEPGSDVARLVAFASWDHFEAVVYDGDDVVIVPAADAARVRIRPQRNATAARHLLAVGD